MYRIFIIYSPIVWYLICFYFLAISNRAAVNTKKPSIRVVKYRDFEHMLNGSISGSRVIFISLFWRGLHLDFIVIVPVLTYQR